MQVLRAFIDNIKQAPLQGAAKATVTWDPYPMRNPPATGKLTQDFLWSVSQSTFPCTERALLLTTSADVGPLPPPWGPRYRRDWHIGIWSW